MPFNCTAVAAALLAAAPAFAQTQAAGAPATGEAAFKIMIQGQQIGRETVAVARDASGWVITSSGRIEPPIDLTITRFEMKYSPDWQPLELSIAAIQQKSSVALSTSFTTTTAINEITQQGKTVSKEDQTSARTIVLPNHFWGAYEALAARLWTSDAGAVLPLYVAPSAEIKLTVNSVQPQTLTGGGSAINARRYDVMIANIGANVAAIVIVDDRARLVRFEIPSAGLVVVRDDASSVAVRTSIARNPTDSDVQIAANGFTLAGTVTTPPAVAGRLRSPGIVLIGGSGPTDRDETVAGIQIFMQLAGALAKDGAVVLRYDKRGVGQSGGRTDSATLDDYADDAVAAVKWIAKRPDVDPRRIVVVGHSEGAAVALLAASREKQIDGVVSIAGPGVSGADLILQQQRHLLDRSSSSEADKQAKVDLQKKIQAAVLSGTGWEGIPAELRKQADIPWFRSFLAYDPARVMQKVNQPLLVIQGDLDAQVSPDQADKLADLARARKKVRAPEVVHIPGVNHLLVPAATGEVSEYGSLQDKTVSPKVASAITDWIKMALP
ncbi:MAG TPA: alpha/beta fold hydrolase [Vicinamibacterales bacterium]|jgi:pimeloyl-ACP methyl ester carboxylesterase|nr:alpha/beta fold hydrolase [Vicinamibacterales bacterium]